MSRHRQPFFYFRVRGNTRTFCHKPLYQEFSQLCPTCDNQVGADEPFSHHWLNADDAQHIKLGLTEKILLKRIEREHIETFMLCDDSPVERTSQFLNEAGMEAVPQLLRFLNYEASRLEVTIGFYVNIGFQQMIYYEMCPVMINHFLDIEETVELIFQVMMEKILSYIEKRSLVRMEDSWTVKRLKVIVKRHWEPQLQMQLPMQYRVKNDKPIPAFARPPKVDLALLTESFLNYHGKRYAQFPASLKVNIFSLRVCASTKELFTVPYLISSHELSKMPTFLIQTNVVGEFQGFYQINNVGRFLKADSMDHCYICPDCYAHFSETSVYKLHKQINCGLSIVIMELDTERPEIYENCVPLPKEFFKFAWYGIGPSMPF